MSPSNKDLAQKCKSILTDLGHDVSLGHAYELLSKLSGQPSHNHAKSQGVSFYEVVTQWNQAEPIKAPLDPKLKLFEVKIQHNLDEVCVNKFYRLTATSRKEAKEIVQEYVNVRTGEIEESEVKLEGTRRLMEVEDESDFRWTNWELSEPPGYVPDVAEVYEQPPEQLVNALQMQEAKERINRTLSNLKR